MHSGVRVDQARSKEGFLLCSLCVCVCVCVLRCSPRRVRAWALEKEKSKRQETHHSSFIRLSSVNRRPPKWRCTVSPVPLVLSFRAVFKTRGSKRGRPKRRRSSEQGDVAPHRLKFASLVHGARCLRVVRRLKTHPASGRRCTPAFVLIRLVRRRGSFCALFVCVCVCVFCGALRDVCGHGRLKKKRARGKKHTILPSYVYLL